MFSLCEAMKWNHLPGSGTLYDQDPMLMDAFRVIFSERAKYQEQKAKQEKAKARRGGR